MMPGNSKQTSLQEYLVEIGVQNFQGRRPHEMDDHECRECLRWLRDYGRISYIPSRI